MVLVHVLNPEVQQVIAEPSLADLPNSCVASRPASIRKLDSIMVTVGNMRIDCSNFPTRKSMALIDTHPRSYLTFSANANSVPGSKQTATSGSTSDANPRVEVPRNVVVISVSPHFGGARCYSVQTIVTHGAAPRSRYQPAPLEAQASIYQGRQKPLSIARIRREHMIKSAANSSSYSITSSARTSGVPCFPP